MKVLVTGVGGGIGAAIETAFVAAGHRVVGQDVRAVDGVDIVGDLLSADTLAEIGAAIDDKGIDTVVAAHGIAGGAELVDVDQNLVDRILRVNTVSNLRLYEAVAARLRARHGAYIVVASQAALDGDAQNGVYSASKAALLGWARRLTWTGDAPRMRMVCPGMTETPLLVAGLRSMAEAAGSTYEQLLAHGLDSVPNGRLGRPDEIGRTCLWLAELQTSGCVLAAVTGGETFE